MARKQLGTPAAVPVDAVVKQDLDQGIASNATYATQAVSARNGAVTAQIAAEAAAENTSGRLVRDALGLRVVKAVYSNEGPVNPNPGTGGPGDTLTMGSITTLPEGSAASATITGTSPNKILNLAIPRGVRGLPGNDGSDGVDGQDGTPGDRLTIGTVTTVAAGGNATASISGISPSKTLNIGIPRGAAGADGAKGASSAAESVSWSGAVQITAAQMENTINVNMTASITAIALPTLSSTISQTVQLVITKASALTTITWPSSVKWTENAIKTLSTVAGSTDYFSLTWTGKIWIGSFVGKNLA